ncbi:hypothetical protein [Paenibacillus sp. V4I7]|uniref:hypothetical protein n=1 Tax=Paenibacillus sp. V4I7 TaxID=3042307 RepID=UPI0027889CD4|nr:hypothetical protein [Paenibacillus sp. V4I7]MDQ0899247.1 putative membrane protein [Paenibacillus sp. V4I7]
MDILFSLLVFFFMMLFLSTLRALINKDEENSTLLTIASSVLFGCLFWVLLLR